MGGDVSGGARAERSGFDKMAGRRHLAIYNLIHWVPRRMLLARTEIYTGGRGIGGTSRLAALDDI